MLSPTRGLLTPTGWSADGRHVAYSRTQGIGNSTDIWALPLFGDRKPFPLVQTPFVETNAAFSPDGRWFAYQSVESGLAQIYVQPFPTTGGKFQVSKSGGAQAVWRPDGKELFFMSPEGSLMAAAVDTAARFQAGIPMPLFTVATTANTGAVSRQYAATKDGRRFLVNVMQQQSRTIPLSVIVNWPAAVQR